LGATVDLVAICTKVLGSHHALGTQIVLKGQQIPPPNFKLKKRNLG